MNSSILKIVTAEIAFSRSKKRRMDCRVAHLFLDAGKSLYFFKWTNGKDLNANYTIGGDSIRISSKIGLDVIRQEELNQIWKHASTINGSLFEVDR